jgi:hypothetical protein
MVSKSFTSFSLPYTILTFYLLLWNYLPILKMLTETLLRIPFPVIGRCSQVSTPRLLLGKCPKLTYHRQLPESQAASCIHFHPRLFDRGHTGWGRNTISGYGTPFSLQLLKSNCPKEVSIVSWGLNSVCTQYTCVFLAVPIRLREVKIKSCPAKSSSVLLILRCSVQFRFGGVGFLV